MSEAEVAPVRRTPDSPRTKRTILVAAAVVSFLGGAVLQWLYPGIEAMTPVDLGFALAFAFLAFWWFRVDARQHGHRASKALGMLVLLLPIVGLPAYLVRTRGWQRGLLASAGFLGLVLASFVPTLAGSMLVYALQVAMAPA